MKDEICRVVVDIVGRGLVELPWMASREHALAAAKHAQQIADSHPEISYLSLVIQCAVSYIV